MNVRFIIFGSMRYAFLFFFCFSALAGKSQNMQLKQLKSLIERPAELMTDSLQQKGWSLRPELSDKKDNQLYNTFSFGNDQSEHGKAFAWLRFHADDGVINQLYYQPPGVEQYNVILHELQQIGIEKKAEQSIEDNQISTYYVTPGYSFQTIVGSDTYTVMAMTSK